MRKLLSNKDQQSKADVVDQHLILSLLDAQEPKVWRMALDKIGTASFEIKKEKDGETTKLVLKPKKGTAEIIATYGSQQQALQALANASEALQTRESGSNKKAEKTIRTPTASQNGTGNNKWLVALIGALIVIGLYAYLMSLIPNTNVGFEGKSTAAPTSASSPQQTTGVPLDADDLLNGL